MISEGCKCSKERIAKIINNLSEDDLDYTVNDGKIEVLCEFCNKKYSFNKDETNKGKYI